MTASEAISGMNSAPAASKTNASGTTSGSSGNRSAGRVDFGTIMNQSLASKTGSKDNSLYTNVADKAQVKTQTKNQTKTQTDNSGNAALEDNSKVKAEDASGNVSETKETDAGPIDADKVETMLDEVKQKIKDTLGITDEEFEAMLANLGFTVQDLLNPAKLTEFVVQLKGADGAISLITDSVLSQQFKDIMSFINERVVQLAEDVNMTPQEVVDYVAETAPREEFSNVLENVVLQPKDADVQETAEKLPAEDLKQQPDTGVDTSQQTDTFESKITVQTQPESGSTQNQDMQQPKDDAPSQQTASPVDIAANLTQSINEAFGEPVIQETQNVDAADVIRQIIDSIKVVAAESIQSMEIQLNPENLGKIHLTVTAKDGIMTAQLTAQDEAVKKVLESQLAQLKENFNNQGLKVQNVEVTVESHAYDQNRDLAGNDRQNQESGNRRRHLNLDSLMGLDEEELTEDEQHATELLRNEGSSVSYTA